MSKKIKAYDLHCQGLTYAQIAKQMGVATSTVGQYVNTHKRYLSWQEKRNEERLATMYGTDVHDLNKQIHDLINENALLSEKANEFDVALRLSITERCAKRNSLQMSGRNKSCKYDIWNLSKEGNCRCQEDYEYWIEQAKDRISTGG